MLTVFRDRCRLQYLVVAAVTLASLPAGSVHAGRLHPGVAAMTRDADPSRSIAVWVLFADRGFASASERLDALTAAQSSISDAALARRARAGSSLADDADLPVCARYIDAVDEIGSIRHTSRWLNAVSADVPVGRLDELAALPFVAEVRPVLRGRGVGLGPRRAPDGTILEQPDPSAFQRQMRRALPDPFYGESYDQLEEIDVIDAHASGYTGARVVLMMLDTGFRKDHEAFQQSHLVAEHDFVYDDGNTQDEAEDVPYQHWHGTATWGAAAGYVPGTLIGPGYGADILLAKTENYGSETPAEEDYYVAALEWGDALGVEVTSASLIYLTFDGGEGWTYEDLDGDTCPITRAIDRAAQRGILCVNAMGNMGPAPGSLGEPADADSMIACGAVTNENSVAAFSSRGPTSDGRTKPEVVARGVDTWCADANGADLYVYASGTSLSTPLVGGACALVREAHPEWSVMQARQALLATADRSGHPDNDYGWGRIRVNAAIRSAPQVVPRPFSLLLPDDGTQVDTVRPTFAWQASEDLFGPAAAIAYELWIDEDAAFGSPLVYGGINDTTFTVPAPLAPLTPYHWRMIAEEESGYRRLSREDRTFSTPWSADVEESPSTAAPWTVEGVPNPWRNGGSIRWYAPPGSLGQEVRLTILDPAGRRVSRSTHVVSRIGWNETQAELRAERGERTASGVFLLMLEANGHTTRTKLILAR